MQLFMFTTEQLQDEVNKRAKIKEKGMPELIENPDLSEVKEKCQSYIISAFEEKKLKGTCTRFESYDHCVSIFRALLIALYGKNIGDWLNE